MYAESLLASVRGNSKENTLDPSFVVTVVFWVDTSILHIDFSILGVHYGTLWRPLLFPNGGHLHFQIFVGTVCFTDSVGRAGPGRGKWGTFIQGAPSYTGYICL